MFNRQREEDSLKIIISDSLTTTRHSIRELYRGFNELPDIFFKLPTLVAGVFCRYYPDCLSINEVAMHKTINKDNNFRFMGMSESKEVSNGWGNSIETYITIDPTLFRDFIIDVHASYERNMRNFPGRMAREVEHIALGTLFCSIKSLTVNGKTTLNPFYIVIDPENKYAIQKFKVIYTQYLNFLKGIYNQKTTPEENKLSVENHTKLYLAFYAEFCGTNNPFHLTLSELKKIYPDYMQLFINYNDDLILQSTVLKGNQYSIFKKNIDLESITLQQIITNNELAIFNEHFYIKNINKTFETAKQEVTTCYNDSYSYFYE